MAEIPEIEISLKDTDVFKGFVRIMQDVLEDGRVPVDVKHKIRNKIKELVNKEE